MSLPLRPNHQWLRRLINMLLLGLLLLIAAAAVNLIGISLSDSIDHWQQWIADRAGYFFAWRLCLYAAILAAWPWARRHRLVRDPQSHQQLRFIEVLGALCIVLSEASNWLQLY
ncbi:hypothetical protein OI70_19035 [Dickeya fangzhongdai]|uniref:hypothetical protein n=1 Tax=Dickeya fangzhongdai TaxID=1778540 RepID=UPI000573F6DE|nr:hypothetical protein [Dickeya fangzhongdai]KHN52896.1 hypothetical protein OI70_19035 [Dickeya fangzhongdai]